MPKYLQTVRNRRSLWQRSWKWLLGGGIILALGSGGLAYQLREPAVKRTPKTVPVTKNAPTITAANPIPLKTSAKEAIVIDAHTGQILGEKRAHRQVGIASESKLLTANAVLKAIRAKKISWATMVPITKKSDWSKKDPNVYAHLDVHEGQRLPVRTLFNAMYTFSANDAAFALADFVKPPRLTQQQALQKWAKELRLTNSQWYNAAGQLNRNAGAYEVPHQKFTAENQASVAQIAKVTYQNLKLDPAMSQDFQADELVYHPTERETRAKPTEFSRFRKGTRPYLHNPLNLTFKNFKTGSTPKYGGGVAALMKDQAGHELIVVVNGAGNYISRFPRFQTSVTAATQVLEQTQPMELKTHQRIQNLSTIKHPHAQSRKLEHPGIYWASTKLIQTKRVN
ncbi:serine hydrolase [Fructilactobacillus ixorae]|uniref:Serine hydrolase n=1 Tax=Fructilactobacillus ixorae TaxID=1750535 RepID=A0ABY5C7I8_9LACO|nr:serine hydrolase [Fructilactobacillus ixorae]USS93271.1 serine hydrolase [Fructilactobacillus ixorae]